VNSLNISYSDVQDAVMSQSTCVTAAEAHGLLCGLLCLDDGISCDTWLDFLFGDEDEVGDDERERLDALFLATRQHLDEFDFSFDLLLPEEATALSERAEALGEWCSGFLAGLGYRSQTIVWSPEGTGILRDLSEISRLDPNASDEEGESAYAELAEYVRVAVQMLRTEARSDRAGSYNPSPY